MSLEKYSVLREKVINQMNKEAKEVKTIAVEEWAKENGYDEVYFSTYDEAKEWIENNVNTNRKNKKSFNKFESEVDETLEGVMEELENGSSSSFQRTMRFVSNKYISPAVKTLLVATAINFIAAKGVELGMTVAGKKLHEWSSYQINDIGFSEKIQFLVKAQDKVKEFLEGSLENIHEFYSQKVVPIAGIITSAVVGFFQAKGIIKNSRTKSKIKNLKDKNEEKDTKIEVLEAELKQYKKSEKLDDEIFNKRGIALKNVGKIQQMNYIVSQMKEMFKDEGIDIPDIPEDCLSMEEYGKFLREELKGKNISSEKSLELFTVMDIYKDNIGAMCRQLRMGKTGIVSKTKEAINLGTSSIGKGVSKLKTRANYTIQRIVKNALKKGINSDDVNGIPKGEVLQEQEQTI